MALLVRPDRCPNCLHSFQLGYGVFRKAPVSSFARTVLAGGIGTTLILLVVLFYFGRRAATGSSNWNMDDRAYFYLLIMIFGLVAALTPAWLGWRYHNTSARAIKIACTECNWNGLVWVKESSDPGTGFRGVGYVPSPLDSRRERKQARDAKERRRAREAEHEGEPNPDLDFRDR